MSVISAYAATACEPRTQEGAVSYPPKVEQAQLSIELFGQKASGNRVSAGGAAVGRGAGQ